MSETFEHPFTNEVNVRRRMVDLVHAKYISCHQYVTGQNYYKVTRQGYRLIEGSDAVLPSRSFFHPVNVLLHEHTRAIADFVTAVHANALRHGVTVSGFYRENSLKLSIGNRSLLPDCAFQLTLPDGRALNYLVEIDCATEPLRSQKLRETLQRKVQFYDDYADRIQKKFIAVFLFTKASARLANFIELANETIKDRQRTLVYAGLLPHFLNQGDPLASLSLLTKQHNSVGLLPSYVTSAEPVATLAAEKTEQFLDQLPTIW